MSELIEVNRRELCQVAQEELSREDKIKFDDTFIRDTQDLMIDEIFINESESVSNIEGGPKAALSDGIVAQSKLILTHCEERQKQKKILEVSIFKLVFESVFVNPDKIFKAKWTPDSFGGRTDITFSLSGGYSYMEVRENPDEINAAIRKSQRRGPEL